MFFNILNRKRKKNTKPILFLYIILILYILYFIYYIIIYLYNVIYNANDIKSIYT